MPSDEQVPPHTRSEAWDAYFDDERLVEGADYSNVIDAMRAAFSAGWEAALASRGAAGAGE